MPDYEARFGAIGRLYGVDGLKRLSEAHVCVIGLGGVGSWAVEALARTGIGKLTLIDMDEVCLSNVNRQLHALDGTIGRSKAVLLGRAGGEDLAALRGHGRGVFFDGVHNGAFIGADLRLHY